MPGLRQLGVPPTVSSPARWREEPGDHVQHGGLAGAVRAEQAGHAGPDGHRDVVDRHHVAVPAGDIAQLDRAHAAPTFRYLAARPARLTASSSRNMIPYRKPTLPGGGMGPGFVPPSHCLTPSSTLNGLISPPSLAPSGATACGPSGPPLRPGRPLLGDVDQDRGQRPGEEQVDRDDAGGVGAAAGQRGEHQPDRREQHRPERRDAHAGNQRPGLGPDRRPTAGGEDRCPRTRMISGISSISRHAAVNAASLANGIVQAAQRPRHVQRQHVAAQVPGHQLRRLGRHEDQHDQGPQRVGVGVVVDYRGLTGVVRQRDRVDDRGQAHQREHEDRHDLGLDAAADPERRPQAVPVQRPDDPGPARGAARRSAGSRDRG